MQKIAALTLLCCSLSQVQSTQQFVKCQKHLPLPFCGGKNQQPCFTSCSNPKFDSCPDFYIAIYDPKVCGYTKDGRWLNYNSQCQACKNTDVTAVVGKICNCSFTGCPSGQTCENGQCVDIISKPDCRVIRCANGYQCIDGKGCVPIQTDPCGGKCKNYQFCSSEGQCLDNCAFIKCTAGFKCEKGQCIPDKPSDPCGGKCKNYEFCSPQGQCLDNCARIRCASGYTCQKGQCVPNKPSDPCGGKCKSYQFCSSQGQCIDNCAFIKCTAGFKCEKGQCVPDKPSDPCGGKCKNYEFCSPQGQCLDNCARIRCASGYTCQKGQCIPNKNPPIDPVDPSCAAILCLQGTQCINGRCVPLNNDKVKKLKCPSPRPNQQNCPVIYYFRAPDPVACGIDRFGNRQDYSQICSACKDTNNIFYYDVPCSQVPDKPSCLSNQKFFGGKCTKHDQNLCEDDNDCSFADFCINGVCEDKCKFAKCALGFTCRFGDCVPDLKLKKQFALDDIHYTGRK